jgi:peptidyl-prolyl cis-trans isomerase SurA
MKSALILLLFFAYIFPVHGKLLDKIISVINTRVVTLSEVNRVIATLKSRYELSPMVFEDFYNKKEINIQSIAPYFWQVFIVRDNLAEIGYSVSDDMVEERIQSIESRENVKRSDLMEYLKHKGISFNEYFEIMRETIEFNIFLSRIIGPLINVTEQEIKSYYYKNHKNKDTVNFIYTLVDYIIPANKVLSSDLDSYKQAVEKYHATSIIPEIYSVIEKIEMDPVSEDTLSANIRKVLQGLNEEDFSKPIVMNNYYHVFYIIKKDIAESSEFIQMKPMIHAKLAEEKVKSIADDWFNRSYKKYYIKELY